MMSSHGYVSISGVFKLSWYRRDSAVAQESGPRSANQVLENDPGLRHVVVVRLEGQRLVLEAAADTNTGVDPGSAP